MDSMKELDKYGRKWNFIPSCLVGYKGKVYTSLAAAFDRAYTSGTFYASYEDKLIISQKNYNSLMDYVLDESKKRS